MNGSHIGFLIIGMLISFIGDLIEMRKMRKEYEEKIKVLEKDIRILKGSNVNG